MKASAKANANIALVKYWGKRDERLILPHNSSISMTVNSLYSYTTVEFAEKYHKDIFVLDDRELKDSSSGKKRIVSFLDIARDMTDIRLKAKVVSRNNFPTSSGLASSASGFAALATAVNEALRLNLDRKNLSILARQGSGSATRSVFGGFVEWKKGTREDGLDSFAVKIAGPEYWKEFRMVICITTTAEKSLSSREAMRTTVKTSSFYKSWLGSVSKDLIRVRNGIKQKNFELVAKTAEKNCLKMHAVIMTSWPPLVYWNNHIAGIIKSLVKWRKQGLNCYFTIDAGPQVKIICLEKDVSKIMKRCEEIEGIKNIIVARPGQGARITGKHLF